MRKSLSTLVAGFVFAIVHAASAQDASRPEVWLEPRKIDFVPIIDGSAPEKPWNEVAGRVGVLSVNEGFIRSLPDETVACLVRDLERHLIDLAMGILPKATPTLDRRS